MLAIPDRNISFIRLDNTPMKKWDTAIRYFLKTRHVQNDTDIFLCSNTHNHSFSNNPILLLGINKHQNWIKTKRT